MDKRKLILLFVAIIIIAFAFSLINKEEIVVESPINIEVGQEFTGIEYSQKKYIINYKIADITGDSINDVAILVAEKDSPDAKDVKNVDIVLYDGSLQRYIKGDLKKFEGNTPKIEIADLTGDSINDIIAILDTNIGDKTIRIVTLENENLKEIFKAKDNNYINFTGNFIDGFKVCLKNRKLNINKELDLKNNSETFIENKIFNESGKYLENGNSKIKTTGFVELELVQLTGSMGLKTKQRIVTNNNSIIDEIDIIWKFEEGKWKIKEAKGLKLGNLLY